MEQVKLAVIGTGEMAAHHFESIVTNQNVQLVGICDTNRERANAAGSNRNVPVYYDYHELLERSGAGAVVIATPHFSHTPISIGALRRGIHVLVEKPIAAEARDATAMIGAYNTGRFHYPTLVFATNFVLRARDLWQRVRQIVAQGAIGRLMRATWVVTDWFRTQAYFDSADWRATWRGEGGGLLLNQAVHNLDLYHWLFGLPSRVRGFASLGKYHDIEVEDEVTVLFEHENGMLGHLIASTAESPGTNRLEVVGELGRIVVEDERVTFDENQSATSEVISSSTDRFATIPSKRSVVDLRHRGDPDYKRIFDNFIDAIQFGEELIAPAVEGHASVSLANAITMSSLREKSIELPLDEEEYHELLNGLIGDLDGKT